MIEIVYDEANEMMRSSDRVKYELPKNIRQVGNAPGNYKIYVEDYVMTYLRRIASPGNMNCRGAILLGKVYDENGTKVIFVSGAVDAQNLEFDISMIKFGDSEWSGIYAEINKYFDDLSIVGWFLSRMGFSAEINDQMKRLHRDNFPGEGKILFLMDALECEEAFYYYDHGTLMREKGYYIYYVRNEKMQNYIISRKRETAESATDSVVIKDKTVVENFRERGKQTENRKKRSWGTTAACFVAVCAVSFGALWYISPDTVGQITDRLTKAKHSGEVQVFMNSADTMAGAEKTVGGAASGDAYTQKNTPGSQNTEATQNAEGVQDTEMAQKANGSQDISAAQGAENTSASVEETSYGSEYTSDSVSDEAVTSEIPSVPDDTESIYVVEPGDTLVSISIKMYGTQDGAESIAAVNGLKIDEPIYEGQKLVIPYTD